MQAIWALMSDHDATCQDLHAKWFVWKVFAYEACSWHSLALHHCVSDVCWFVSLKPSVHVFIWRFCKVRYLKYFLYWGYIRSCFIRETKRSTSILQNVLQYSMHDAEQCSDYCPWVNKHTPGCSSNWLKHNFRGCLFILFFECLCLDSRLTSGE